MRSLLGAVLGPRSRPRAQMPISLAPAAAAFRGLFTSSAATAADTTAIESYGAVGTLFNIVSTLATSTASAQWKLYRSAKSGNPDDRKQITNHQALNVWNRPNAFMSGMYFREAQQQHVDLCGEGCWVIQYDGRATFPVGMWPVRPDRIEPVPSQTEFLSGYVYRGPDGEQVPLKIHEVIRPMMPNPGDPYRGMGPVQALLADLDSERFSAAWNRNFFRNDASPGGIVNVPEGLDEADFRRLQMRWNEQHRGVAAAHRVAILEGGMSWTDRAFSQRDMQFAELRTVGQDIIRAGFGFPKFAAGEVGDVNRATAEASDRWFDKHLTVVRLDRIRDVLNTQFLPLFGSTGKGVEFDYESPVGKDEEAEATLLVNRGQALQALIDAGADPESAAAMVGLPDLKFTGPPVRVRATPALPPGDTEPVPGEPAASKALPPGAGDDPVAARFRALAAGVRAALEPAPAVEQEPDGDDDSDADNSNLDGCMIALMPTPGDAERLAVSGGELATDLHCTLLYLGPEPLAWPDKARAAVIDSVAAMFAGVAPIPARVFGSALWNANGEKPAWVWSVGDDPENVDRLDLATAHELAEAAAWDVAALLLPDQHEPWAAHVCAAYSRDPALLEVLNQRLGPVTFDRVRVSFGDQDTDIPLQAAIPDGPGSVRMVESRLENAQRWVSIAHLDDNTCQACRDNDGHVYRNRKAAYAEYPDGHGYVNCVGAEFGNKCRCRVVKRGRKGKQ